jgi:hypothetical protein
MRCVTRPKPARRSPTCASTPALTRDPRRRGGSPGGRWGRWEPRLEATKAVPGDASRQSRRHSGCRSTSSGAPGAQAGRVTHLMHHPGGKAPRTGAPLASGDRSARDPWDCGRPPYRSPPPHDLRDDGLRNRLVGHRRSPGRAPGRLIAPGDQPRCSPPRCCSPRDPDVRELPDHLAVAHEPGVNGPMAIPATMYPTIVDCPRRTATAAPVAPATSASRRLTRRPGLSISPSPRAGPEDAVTTPSAGRSAMGGRAAGLGAPEGVRAPGISGARWVTGLVSREGLEPSTS